MTGASVTPNVAAHRPTPSRGFGRGQACHSLSKHFRAAMPQCLFRRCVNALLVIVCKSK